MKLLMAIDHVLRARLFGGWCLVGSSNAADQLGCIKVCE